MNQTFIATEKKRDSILIFYRAVFIITIFVVSVKAAMTMIDFTDQTTSLYSSELFGWPDFYFGFPFYFRAIFVAFLHAAPDVLIQSAIFSFVYIVHVYLIRQNIQNPLIGSQYLSSFLFFLKEFFMFGLLVLVFSIIASFFVQSVINF